MTSNRKIAMNTMTPLVRGFVSHFGEMGSRWGINRTVGQIYALIYMSPRPLNADDIAEALEFSRSNVSMGLKELQSWRLVRLKRRPLVDLLRREADFGLQETLGNGAEIVDAAHQQQPDRQ